MKYYKSVNSNYIIGIGTEHGAEEITEEEYETILFKIRTQPVAPYGYVNCLLNNSLDWEQVSIPPDTLFD